ncbi:peptidoglycan binding domain-containing protein [bacterium]|nr:peptidoglycan binding domain-containing protein [bacterium]
MQNVKAIRNYNTPPQPSTRHRPEKRSQATIWVLLGALIVIVPLALTALTVVAFQVFEWNLPGVQIFDKDVGLMSHEDTVAWIDSYWNNSRLITLQHPQDPDYAFVVSPQELGYWVDPTATADAAFAIGRDSTPTEELSAAIFGESQMVLPVMYYDENIARQTLTALADDLAVPPVEASVAYQDGTWVAIPGTPGQAVDIDATLASLYQDAFNIYLAQAVTLQITAQAPAISDLTPVLDEIQTVVTQDLTLAAHDPITGETTTWSVPADVKHGWVSVDPDSYDISLAYEPDDVADLVEGWQNELDDSGTRKIQVDANEIIDDWQAGRSPVAIVHHAPTTYNVSGGESLWSISLKLGMPMWYIMDANEGLTMENLEAGMTLTIPSKNDLLPLPVVPNKRIVIDISSQSMTVYENDAVRNTYVVSTGVSNSPTMAGIFQIQTHEINAYASNWDLYMPHFMGIYEAWPGFMNGIHGLPLLSSGQRLWASTLGSPASYGCIILDLAAAEDLYNWAEEGVVVEITQ